MNDDYFTKLPNNLFINENGDKNLLRLVEDSKVLLVLDYLYTNTNRKGESLFILQRLIEQSGYAYNEKNRININSFKSILVKLQHLKIIKSNIHLNNIKPKQYIECSLNIDLSQKYIKLYEWEKEKILNQSEIKVDNLKLLIYYCYLKSKIYKRPDGVVLHRDTEIGEACYPSFKIINKDIGISEEIIDKYNQILEKLELIKYKSAGKCYYKTDKTKLKRETPNFYVLYKDGWEEELSAAISHYKKQHSDIFIFTNEDYINNDKKTNGFIGRIEYLEKIGKATNEQIEKKNKLIEQKDIINGNNDRKFFIQGLLNSCDEELLVSDIYELKGQLNNAEKEYNLELSLGLIDTEGNLLGDYDYYKWTMINYKPGQHDYYVNCVKKHIKEQNDKFNKKGLWIDEEPIEDVKINKNKINDVNELSQEEYNVLMFLQR